MNIPPADGGSYTEEGNMPRSWGPFSGRQLTTIVIAVCTTLVVAPGAVWAVDTFSNVAVEDPGSGVKANVDSTHHLLVGDGSGPLTVDGTAVQTMPSTQKTPFHAEAFLVNFNSNGFQAVTNPSTATVALTHLVVTSRAVNSGPWDVFLYEVEGATAAECVNNMGNSALWVRLAARGVAPGQTSADDFTTPTILKPLHTGASWCIVTGAEPATNTGNVSGLVLDYSGFVTSGSFTPPPSAAAAAKRSAASP